LNFLSFTRTEVTAALARGVRQCVVIGASPFLHEVLQSVSNSSLSAFVVDEEAPCDSQATFIPTQFDSETLAAALERSGFDQRKASLFIWLGGAGYRTLEAILASLSFIASFPQGSGVLLDYIAERTSPPPLTHTALDGLASHLTVAGNRIKYLIQPSAVMEMLRGLGFQEIVDRVLEEQHVGDSHFVSASI
jgi:O-methyltransferase involved in polyketide biosynthesis